MRHKQTDEHKLSYFLLKTIAKTILRKQNMEQIYDGDMTETLERYF